MVTLLPVSCTGLVMVNGRVLEPPSSIVTPSWVRASRVVPMGLRLAEASPSRCVAPATSAATGGINRITVPARPQSIKALTGAGLEGKGSTRKSGPNVPSPSTAVMVTPRLRRASTMSAVSLECRGRITREGPVASAARTNSRFVSDFDPGRLTACRRGWARWGAGHPSREFSEEFIGCPEYRFVCRRREGHRWAPFWPHGLHRPRP